MTANNIFSEKITKVTPLRLGKYDEILLAAPDENGWCAAVIDRDGNGLVDYGFMHIDQVSAAQGD